MRFRRWPDWAGSLVALTCAAHCASLTVIFTLYPALWLNRRYWEMGLWQKLFWLERGLLALTWVIWTGAAIQAWRQHRQAGPIILGSLALLGLTTLILSPLHFSGRWTGVAAVVAGLSMAAAHGWNLYLARRASRQALN